MAHIFTKSGAGGVTAAIPSGVCLSGTADLGDCPWLGQSLAEGQVELWRPNERQKQGCRGGLLPARLPRQCAAGAGVPSGEQVTFASF